MLTNDTNSLTDPTVNLAVLLRMLDEMTYQEECYSYDSLVSAIRTASSVMGPEALAIYLSDEVEALATDAVHGAIEDLHDEKAFLDAVNAIAYFAVDALTDAGFDSDRFVIHVEERDDEVCADCDCGAL